MAKQNNTPEVAETAETVEETVTETTEETPETVEETVEETISASQAWAAKKKAELKALSDSENAAYIAAQEAKKAAAKEKAGVVEEEEDLTDDTDYSQHNTLGERIKARLAEAKAAATQSIPLC